MQVSGQKGGNTQGIIDEDIGRYRSLRQLEDNCTDLGGKYGEADIPFILSFIY